MTIETVSEVRAVESAKCFEVLGVRFAAVQIPDVTRKIEEWIANDRKTHYITVSNVHSVIECQRDVRLMETLNGSDLNVPDGMPIIWCGRSYGYVLPRRVYGPDLFYEFCNRVQDKPYRHFFYGGALWPFFWILPYLKVILGISIGKEETN